VVLVTGGWLVTGALLVTGAWLVTGAVLVTGALLVTRQLAALLNCRGRAGLETAVSCYRHQG